jgi:hypothetical protein
MQQFFSLLSWRLFTAQHVSGVFPPIIRNSMTAVAASGFTFVSWWQSCCVHGWAGQPDLEHSTSVITVRRWNQRLPLQSLSSWWWAGKCPKNVELQTDVRTINWKAFASGWWFIWIKCKTLVQNVKGQESISDYWLTARLSQKIGKELPLFSA